MTFKLTNIGPTYIRLFRWLQTELQRYKQTNIGTNTKATANNALLPVPGRGNQTDNGDTDSG